MGQEKVGDVRWGLGIAFVFVNWHHAAFLKKH